MSNILKTLALIISLIGLISCSYDARKLANTTKPTSLTAEGHSAPLNVHNPKTRLSWLANVARQSSYQIHVATTPEKLISEAPDLWNSGIVTASQSHNIAYQGPALQTNDKAYWRVKVWQEGQLQSQQWSEVATWQMGLLNNNDWQAKWIQAPVAKTLSTKEVSHWIDLVGTVENENGSIDRPAIEQLNDMPTASLFRHQFNTSKTVVSARLHSTAGGYYELFINGKKVKDRIMDPGQTDFDKRIMYNTDDVSKFLKIGSNVIAVHLGSGWYNENIAFSRWKNPDGQYTNKADRTYSYGRPTFIAQLELAYQDGTTERVNTNDSWLTHPSPTVKEGIFSGELYDANQAIFDWHQVNSNNAFSHWQTAKALPQWPTQTLTPQLLPTIKPVKHMNPVKVLNPRPNVWVYDFGQNFTGLPSLHLDKLSLKSKQAVYLRYAEWQDEQGNISQLSGGSWATHLNAVDGYIPSNSVLPAKTWTPSFTWRGFRYVEITGLTEAPPIDALSAQLIRSDVNTAGHFSSSDPLINRIHQTALWTYESNLMSVPLDCPIREKAGWTGDAHAALITGNYNYDMQLFWSKYLEDFTTAKHLAPTVVPGKRTGGGKVDWAVAEVFIAWEHYRHYGDMQTLQNQYDSLNKYMAFGQTQMSAFLIKNGYGDWCDPVKQPGLQRVGGRGTPQWTSTDITSTALFTQAANLMSKISKLLDDKAQSSHYQQLYKNMSHHFHIAFYNPDSQHYGSQTADAMAIQFGITPPHLRQVVADALNKDVVENWQGHSSVGALGQTYLYLTLSDYGYVNTAFNIFKAKGYPGFSYLFDTLNGTTLWERKGAFDPSKGRGPLRSLNHPFHSGYDGWFYQGLGGIRPLDNSVGFQEFLLKPVFPNNLSQVNASFNSPYGKIKSNWDRKKESIDWQVSIPNNSQAWIELPDREKQRYGAGDYQFNIKLK